MSRFFYTSLAFAAALQLTSGAGQAQVPGRAGQPGAAQPAVQAGQQPGQQGQPGQPGQPGRQVQPGQPGRQVQVGQPGQRGQGQFGQPGQRMQANAYASKDWQLTQLLIIDNQGEIELAQLAAERSENDDVKAFAKKMLEDHQAMLNSLQKISHEGQQAQGQPGQPGAGSTAAGQGQASPDANATNTTTTPTSDLAVAGQRRDSASPSGAAMGTRPGTLDIVQLKRELAEQCLQSAKNELGQKDGAEFDKCYVGNMIVKHQQAVDTLTVFRNHATGELQRNIDEAMPKVQSHLQHAKDLMKKLDDSSSDKS